MSAVHEIPWVLVDLEDKILRAPLDAPFRAIYRALKEFWMEAPYIAYEFPFEHVDIDQFARKIDSVVLRADWSMRWYAAWPPPTLAAESEPR